MEIQCRSFSSHIVNNNQTLLCNEVRHDLALEQITREKGISFVLDSFGEQAIAEYLRQQGFHVLDNVSQAIKAA